jgi:hypothetical protein
MARQMSAERDGRLGGLDRRHLVEVSKRFLFFVAKENEDERGREKPYTL